jgi:hypothetical protein
LIIKHKFLIIKHNAKQTKALTLRSSVLENFIMGFLDNLRANGYLPAKPATNPAPAAVTPPTPPTPTPPGDAAVTGLNEQIATLTAQNQTLITHNTALQADNAEILGFAREIVNAQAIRACGVGTPVLKFAQEKINVDTSGASLRDVYNSLKDMTPAAFSGDPQQRVSVPAATGPVQAGKNTTTPTGEGGKPETHEEAAKRISAQSRPQSKRKPGDVIK